MHTPLWLKSRMVQSCSLCIAPAKKTERRIRKSNEDFQIERSDKQSRAKKIAQKWPSVCTFYIFQGELIPLLVDERETGLSTWTGGSSLKNLMLDPVSKKVPNAGNAHFVE